MFEQFRTTTTTTTTETTARHTILSKKVNKLSSPLSVIPCKSGFVFGQITLPGGGCGTPRAKRSPLTPTKHWVGGNRGGVRGHLRSTLFSTVFSCR